MDQLPGVAKSFSTYCGKCASERYHRVLTHLSSTSAKIECEICHSKKSFKLGASRVTKKNGAPTKLALKRSSAREASVKAHHDEYQGLLENAASSQAYKVSAKFEVNQKVAHPKFGLGIVRQVSPDRIEVVFADEVRQLIHNR
ncbi:MAG: hypothetical protein WCH11_06525 [Bdellovibrio sp.]